MLLLLFLLLLQGLVRSWVIPHRYADSLRSSLHVVTKACESPNPLARDETTTPFRIDADAAEVKKFYIETHGCQMNLADSDIVNSVLQGAGYEACEVLEDADLILTNTCAIRENAEHKIWQRLKYFSSLRKKAQKEKLKPKGYPLVGVLGCMAERLKSKLLDEEGVDFIAGPDAYRELPALLTAASTDQKAANVQLSIEETYSDIQPVKLADGNTHAFVTITRGCDNHCAFCIVPYVRGRERSRPVESILSEVDMLKEQGYKEVVLLGQNVNSYNYLGEGEDSLSNPHYSLTGRLHEDELSKGFTQPGLKNFDGTLPQGMTEAGPDLSTRKKGVRFEELLQQVASKDPEMRIRFQSPHPKDFPDELLQLIAETPNICNSIHMPAQHGASTVLERMRRGYDREAYLGLVKRARDIIGKGNPANLGLSSDFISGFCGETEKEHLENLSLLREVGFDQAFTYSYSRREQTFAGLFMEDDVQEKDKARRLAEMIDTFQSMALKRNMATEIGRIHVVLVEGKSQKLSSSGAELWTGRTDTNKRVVFEDLPVLASLNKEQAYEIAILPVNTKNYNDGYIEKVTKEAAEKASADVDRVFTDTVAEKSWTRNSKIKKGIYVCVKIAACRGHTLRGIPISITTLVNAHGLDLLSLPSS